MFLSTTCGLVMTIQIETQELGIPENKVAVQTGQKVKVKKGKNGQMTITVTVEVELIDLDDFEITF